jgi:hypothetical protein
MPELRKERREQSKMNVYTESIRKFMGWYPTKNSFGDAWIK